MALNATRSKIPHVYSITACESLIFTQLRSTIILFPHNERFGPPPPGFSAGKNSEFKIFDLFRSRLPNKNIENDR